jgi:uncharacterized protein (DUF2252 family)
LARNPRSMEEAADMSAANTDRLAQGRSLRSTTPRSSWGDWTPAKNRDPLGRLEEQNAARVAKLIPTRRRRMTDSPFAYFRGAAAVMADDLLTAPSAGITVQSCGDAHLLNFGVFGSPERALVFDITDFDETSPAPFEWDVARLATSAVLAARASGFTPDQGRAAALAAVNSYRLKMQSYADRSTLAIWYERVDAKAAASVLQSVPQSFVKREIAKMKAHTSSRLLAKLTVTSSDGTPRIVEQPPLVTHLETDRYLDELREMYETYRESLPYERQTLISRFHVVDFAAKAVGVGSVGTLCFVALLLDDTNAPLFLQVKQAEPSVLAVTATAPNVDHQGQRVVHGQRVMQAVSDQFLGASRVGKRDFYVRQLQDMKGSVDVALLPPRSLREYLELCGWVLARAHARSGAAPDIAGYLGCSDRFDRAMARFAVAYADVTDADHAELSAVVDEGGLEAADEESA